MELRHRQLPVLIVGLLFFVINFSGDHVFYKTNTLNLFWLAISCCVLTITFMVRLKSDLTLNTIGRSALFTAFTLLPLIATVPGLIINGSAYNYFSAHEYAVHLLTIIWAALLLSSLKNTQSVVWLLNWIAVVVVYFFILAILQKFGVKPLLRFGINFFDATWANWQVPYSGHVNRIAATTGNPNYLAGMVIQLAPVFVSLAIVARSKQAFLYTLVVLAILFLCIESGSRGALIALIVSLIFFFLLACYLRLISIRPLYIAVFATVMGVVLTYIAFNTSWIDRIVLIGTDSSSITRLHIWQAAINSIKQAPILGFGTGSSYALFFSFADPDIRLFSGRSFVHPHNDWLEILQEGGLLGLGAYLAFWTGIFIYALRFIKTAKIPQGTRLFALGILAGLLAIHVHGMVSVAPRMVVVRLVTFSLLACLFYLIQKPFNKNTTAKTLPLGVRTKWQVIIVLSVTTLSTTAYVLYYSYGQSQHASVISTSQSQPNILIDVSNKSIYNDVFLLDRAIDSAQQVNDHTTAINYSNRLHEQLPFYRDVKHEEAASLFELQRYEQAYKVAQEAHRKDRYHLANLELLLHLSQQQQDTEGFQTYFTDLLRFHLCKNSTFSCLPVNVDRQSTVNIIQRHESGLHYTVNINAFITPSEGSSGFKLVDANSMVRLLSGASLISSNSAKVNPITLQEIITTKANIDELKKQRQALAVFSGLGFWVDRERYLIQNGNLTSLILNNETRLSSLESTLPVGFEVDKYMGFRQFIIDFVKSCVANK